MGNIQVTSRAVDKISFMDKITQLEMEAVHNEILRPRTFGFQLFAMPIYKPLEIIGLYQFNGSDKVLRQLEETTHYTLDDGKILFVDSLKNVKDLTISARYLHNPAFFVMDVNREHAKTREKECSLTDEQLNSLPIFSIARRAHYIFNKKNFDESNILDNA